MNQNIPLLLLPSTSNCEELSPRSEDFREGIETRQQPFYFPTSDTISMIPCTFTQASKQQVSEVSTAMRFVQKQFKEIELLKNTNQSLKKKLDLLEDELRGLRRLRTMMREKDRKIKELENLLEIVTDEIKTLQIVNAREEIFEKIRPVRSSEFYALHPPRRVWVNPGNEIIGKLNKLRVALKKNC